MMNKNEKKNLKTCPNSILNIVRNGKKSEIEFDDVSVQAPQKPIFVLAVYACKKNNKGGWNCVYKSCFLFFFLFFVRSKHSWPRK